MKYELTALWRTIRREGVRALLTKSSLYLYDVARAPMLLLAPRPKPEAEPVVSFVFEAARGLVAPTQVRSEFLSLARIVGERRPTGVLEIGTARGGTLFAWCALAAEDATVISLDLPNGIHGGGYPYWKTFLYRRFAKPRQKLRLLRGDSHDPAFKEQVLQQLPPGGLDFLFIDGDHTYAGVKMDFEMYAPLVRPGGLIVFHDICTHPPEMNCQVDQFWAEIKKDREYREFIDDPRQGGFGIGLLTA